MQRSIDRRRQLGSKRHRQHCRRRRRAPRAEPTVRGRACALESGFECRANRRTTASSSAAVPPADLRISGALPPARAGLDSGRPRNTPRAHPTASSGSTAIAPGELLARGRAEAEAAGAEICHWPRTRRTRRRHLRGDDQRRHHARAPRRPRLRRPRQAPRHPRHRSYYGGSVFHCPDCDGDQVREKRVGVIGWGKRRSVSARTLPMDRRLTSFTDGHPREWTDEHHSKLLALGIAVRTRRSISLDGENAMVGAPVLATGEHVSVDALFFTIGVNPVPPLRREPRLRGRSTSAQTSSSTNTSQTTVEGIYAIGDLVPGSQLAITSRRGRRHRRDRDQQVAVAAVAVGVGAFFHAEKRRSGEKQYHLRVSAPPREPSPQTYLLSVKMTPQVTSFDPQSSRR